MSIEYRDETNKISRNVVPLPPVTFTLLLFVEYFADIKCCAMTKEIADFLIKKCFLLCFSSFIFEIVG